METLHRPPDNAVLSSSPAFATPLQPIPPAQVQRPPPPPPAFQPTIPTILPILLPPPTLRPLAFRTFTKKHNLTLHSSALHALAAFIGRHCGAGWREEGTGEKVLEEVAKLWKAQSGPVIVEDGEKLKGILKTLEGSMSGGRIGAGKTPSSNNNSLSRQSSFAFNHSDASSSSSSSSHRPSLEARHSSFGLSKLQVDADADDVAEDDNEESSSRDPRAWLHVTSAFDQPRFTYDIEKKHFLPLTARPSIFPSASQKTALFKERYNVIYQRLLRNEAFQAPSFSSTTTTTTNTAAGQQQSFYKITPIANLLGRTGTSHLLLALLVIAPTGTLALTDPSGSIALDLQHAQPLQGGNSSTTAPSPLSSPYICPGMILLVDGIYEEAFTGAGSSGLGNTDGVGGTIGGKFIAFGVAGPPVERRSVSLGIGEVKGGEVGGGFGWVDWGGGASERAVGARMRKLERRLLEPGNNNSVGEERRKMVILAEVTLDQPQTLLALRKLLTHYSSSSSAHASQVPLAFLLIGNFTSRAALANGGGKTTDSISYKESFDNLAAILADHPSLLSSSTWVFVPGDNDPWASAFSAGASTLVPRDAVPELFTRRVRRVFAAANANAKREMVDGGKEGGDEGCVWTTNPTRVSFFGPAHEVLVFRDEVAGRFRRGGVRIGQAVRREDGGGMAQQQRRQQRNGQRESMDGDEDVVMSGALPAPTTDPELSTAMTQEEEEEDHATLQAKKTILSLLPQSTLSPFPPTTRPTHWDYASSALSLYPLPHTLVLADPGSSKSFALTFEGCHVVNPGRFVVDSSGSAGMGMGRGGRMQWVEYDVWTKRGEVRGEWVG